VWQSQTGAAAPVGQARPGWKVLRVLGNLLDLPGFDYQSSEEVREELRGRCPERALEGYAGTHAADGTAQSAAGEPRLIDLPMYQTDAVVRRAPALQKTREGRAVATTY